MPIGVSTLCTFGETFKKISLYREFTPPVIEVLDDWSDRLDRQKVRMLLELESLFSAKFTVHAPIIDLNIASPNERVRQASVDAVRESIDHAREIGALLVVVHPGLAPIPGMIGQDECWGLNLDSMRQILSHAQEEGIRLCLENMPLGNRLIFQHPSDFLRLYEEGIAVEIALDVGHANTLKNLGSFLQMLRGRISHLHLHDNLGGNDDHLVVGEGTVDWALIGREIDFGSVTAVVESRTPSDALRSLRAARQLLRA